MTCKEQMSSDHRSSPFYSYCLVRTEAPAPPIYYSQVVFTWRHICHVWQVRIGGTCGRPTVYDTTVDPWVPPWTQGPQGTPTGVDRGLPHTLVSLSFHVSLVPGSTPGRRPPRPLVEPQFRSLTPTHSVSAAVMSRSVPPVPSSTSDTVRYDLCRTTHAPNPPPSSSNPRPH